MRQGEEAPTPIAIVGAGTIGCGWAIAFAVAGIAVRLHDPDPKQRATAARSITTRIDDLAEFGLVQDAGQAKARVQVEPDLRAAVDGAGHVQECAPEDVELKRRLFAELDTLAPAEAVLASSTSFLPASAFASELRGRARVLVVHPANPPFLLRAVEVVPAAFTDPAAVSRSEALLRAAGLQPVRVRKEVHGFVYNRLQGALLREAYCLVRDGVCEVADIDALVRHALGLRWSITGPFETVDLNSRGGVAAHAARMGPHYHALGRERGQDDPWTPELVAKVEAARRRALPLAAWEARIRWRDRALMSRLAAPLPEPDPD